MIGVRLNRESQVISEKITDEKTHYMKNKSSQESRKKPNKCYGESALSYK